MASPRRPRARLTRRRPPRPRRTPARPGAGSPSPPRPAPPSSWASAGVPCAALASLDVRFALLNEAARHDRVLFRGSFIAGDSPASAEMSAPAWERQQGDPRAFAFLLVAPGAAGRACERRCRRVVIDLAPCKAVLTSTGLTLGVASGRRA